MVQVFVAIFLILHGLVHLLWFVVPWRIMEVDGLPYSTTIIGGRIDVGQGGIRFVGLLWILGAIAFVIAGIGLLFSAPWWWTATLLAAIYSLFLSVLGWPDSKYGALIDVLILAVLYFGNQVGLSLLPFP
jgi:hypothetical protein